MQDQYQEQHVRLGSCEKRGVMMILIIVLAVYVGYMLIGLRSVIKQKNPKVIWSCAILFCVGFVVQALYELHVNVPSPSAPISAFVSSWFYLK